MNKKNRFYLDCSCGCSMLTIDYWEDDMVSIQHLVTSFDSLQMGAWEKLKRKIVFLWNIIRGKEYLLYDILIDDKKKLKEFKNFVSNIRVGENFFESNDISTSGHGVDLELDGWDVITLDPEITDEEWECLNKGQLSDV